MKSEIVSYIFEYVEQNLNYLILRNYENLPEDEGHDIDLLIAEKEYPAAQRLIQELKEHFGIRIFLRDEYDGLYSYCLIIGGTVLHLDFFTQIQWNRISYIPTEEALSRKQRFKNRFWVISDDDFEYYCWVSYLLSAGEVKEKYRQKALQWQEKQAADMLPDIRRGNAVKNRKKLIHRLCASVPFPRLLLRTLGNLCFKAYKYTRMDGRIYICHEPLSEPVSLCRFHCSCKQKDIADTEPFGLWQCISLLRRERSVLISPEHWKTLWWRHLIPRIYTPDCTATLEELLRNIYRNHEC